MNKMVDQKKLCPKCNQFMLLKRIDKETHRKQWECPWCDFTEPYQIEKPKQENTKEYPVIGLNGQCILKDVHIRSDDCWKCVDIRISDEVRTNPSLFHEYGIYRKNHDYVSVCRYCKYCREDVPEEPVKLVEEEPKPDGNQPPAKKEGRFDTLDLV
jgi:hypothetical protein